MHDSDTESEPETSLPLCTATEFTDASRTLKSQVISAYDSTRNAVAAVEALHAFDLSVVQEGSFYFISKMAS